MHGVTLEPGHATMRVDCGLRKKNSRTCFPAMQSCAHELQYLLGQGGVGLVIELSRLTPWQDPPYA